MKKNIVMHLANQWDLSLPLVENGTNVFYSFNLLGKTDLNNYFAQELKRKFLTNNIKADTVVTVEAKAIGLTQSLSEMMKIDRYVVLRKTEKTYMKTPVHTNCTSITSGKSQLWLDGDDGEFLRGKNVIFCDDVISTGGTAMATLELMKIVGANVVVLCCAVTEGETKNQIGNIPIISCGHLPLPEQEKE